ncbi:response regulator [Geomonas edaphica]|uniref:response regulator n=1 Tax=Geomonas edaphica TaxID=2570226 RepID=UPI0010A8E096|nr:response regulator [Geomonas edaphica]
MSEKPPAAKPRLLYVDDERPNLVALRALLRDTYEVFIAETTDEAFALLSGHDIPLVVSDQRMPGMTGTEFLEKVAAAYPDCIRMILTGYSDIDAVINAINRSQIYYYFKKPWNETEIRLTLSNALESIMTQRRLVESERRFRSTFEQAGLGLAHLELEGRVLRANGKLQEFLGATEAELLGTQLSDWLPGFDPTEPLGHPGQLVVREAPVATPQGERWSRLTSSVSLDGQGKPDYLITLVDDLTERRQTEELVLKLYHVVEQSPLSIRITAKNGVVEFVNPSFTRMSGYTAEEMVGKQADLLLSEQAQEADHQTLWDCITSGTVWQGEMPSRAKDGRLLWTRVTVSPVRTRDGVVTHYVTIKEDITERHRLEEQLLQSQKMEAIGQLAGGVAHDFNNILMVIMGYGAMLKGDSLLAPEQKEKVEHILEYADRAAQLTSSLLAFSRKQVMRLQPANLNDIILQVQKFLARVIGEDVQLRSAVSAEPLPVRVDSGQIDQVLMNLVTNARDAMPGGGVVTIETHRQMIEECGASTGEHPAPGPYAVVSVSDTGVGMDETTRTRIFEPFFTTKEPGKGTGLGMSIVYGIIKQHNGFINVYSEPEVGTTFRIYLPLYRIGGAAEESVAAPDAPGRGTETIMVVEDEPSLRQLLDSILTEHGYRVILAQDGEDAIEKFQGTPPGTIALVLMDLIMPRMNGKEACEEIRKVDPSMRVAFTSGYTREFIDIRDALAEDTELIMKPVQPTELLRKVRDLLDRSPAPAA